MKLIFVHFFQLFKQNWKNILWWLIIGFLAVSSIGAWSQHSKIRQESDSWVQLGVIYEGQVVKNNGKYGSVVYGIFKDANGEFITRPISIIEQHILKPDKYYQVSFQRGTLDDSLDKELKSITIRLFLAMFALVVLLFRQISKLSI